jgi:amidase
MALGDPGGVFGPPLRGSLVGLRVGWTGDLGGLLEVDERVATVVEEAGRTMVRAGAHVYSGHPDLGPADECFRTLRAWHFQAALGPLLREHPGALKQSLADNIRAGESLTGADVAHAYEQRTALSETMRQFFTDYDVLAMPVSQVPPFPADEEYPTEINGKPMDDYLAWMRSAYVVSVTGCPAVSVPAGTTPEGWPVGVQLVAAHGQDRRLLEVAAAFENARAVGV